MFCPNLPCFVRFRRCFYPTLARKKERKKQMTAPSTLYHMTDWLTGWLAVWLTDWIEGLAEIKRAMELPNEAFSLWTLCLSYRFRCSAFLCSVTYVFVCTWSWHEKNKQKNRPQHLRRHQQGGAEAHPTAPDARDHAQPPHRGMPKWPTKCGSFVLAVFVLFLGGDKFFVFFPCFFVS